MSCEWTIKCVDCDEVPEEIDNANHQLLAMQFIVANAKTLSVLYSIATKDCGIFGFEVKLNWSVSIPFEFLAKHADHRLRPYSEYGEYDTPCKEKFWCHLCNATVACDSLEHPNRKEHSHSVSGRGHTEQPNETTIQTKG